MELIILSFIGFAVINVIAYTIIPFYIRRSGATLLNISNVTTIIWSMISDIFLFNSKFYLMYVGAFVMDLIGILIYSIHAPIKKADSDELHPSSSRIPLVLPSEKLTDH